MECCSGDPKKVFVSCMRLYFGIWLTYVGLTKWIFFGPNAFVGMITTEFAKTWSPELLNTFLAWLILIAEPVIGLWILSGRRAQCAWLTASLLMFLLVFGQTMLMKPDVIANWEYLLMTIVCAALCPPDPHCKST